MDWQHQKVVHYLILLNRRRCGWLRNKRPHVISASPKGITFVSVLPSGRNFIDLSVFVVSEASDPIWKTIGIPCDLIRFLTKIRMQILGQKLERNCLKKLVNAIFAVKRSILLWFSNFKGWHLQIYQTKLTICLNFMCDWQGPHSGT